MAFEELVVPLTLLATVTSAAVALTALSVTIRARRELDFHQQLLVRPATIQQAYGTRSLEVSLEIEGERVEDLPTLRSRLLAFHLHDAASGKTVVERFWTRSLDRNRAENRLCYALSIEIQRLGLLCATGAAPLGPILFDHARAVADDWYLVHRLVTDIREQRGSRLNRLQGEWIALVSVLFLRYLDEGAAVPLASPWGGIQHAMKREAEIQELLRPVMADPVRRQVRALRRGKTITFP